jgi:uncharacterized membrane protein
MAIQIIAWLVAIPLLGFATGLRSLTPMAVLCWFGYAGVLSVDNGWDDWVTWLWVAVLTTVLALGELVADKFPWIPDRVSPGPLIWRFLMGGLAGAIAADVLNGSNIEGILLGVLGVAIGAFGGFMVRRDLCEKLDCKDWQIAFAEDLVAIGCAAFALHVITT